MPREVPRRSSASRGTSEVYRDRHSRTGSRYARWRSLLDHRCSEVECLARPLGGRVPREGRARCIETATREPGLDTLAGARYSTSERKLALATRPPMFGGRVPREGRARCIETATRGPGLDTLAGARYSTTDVRRSSASRGTSEVYRDRHSRTGSRYARWRSLLDHRCSEVECLARDERGVSRPPLANPVSIRSLALATRPPMFRGRAPREAPRRSSALRGTSEVYRDRVSRTGSRYARWRSLLDHRCSGVERLARNERGVSRPQFADRVSIRSLALATRPPMFRGRAPREAPRRSSASRGTSEVYRDRHSRTRSRYARWRSLLDHRGEAGARYSTTERRRSSASRGTSEVYRDRVSRTGSRYARWRSLLDHRGEAGARYSTNEGKLALATRPPMFGGRVPREGRARCIETASRGPGLDTLAGARYSTTEGKWRSLLDHRCSEVECLARDERGVSRPGLADRVSIRSLALATRPPRESRRSRLDHRCSEVECLARDERGVSRPPTRGPGLDTLAGARYSTTEGRGARYSTTEREVHRTSGVTDA